MFNVDRPSLVEKLKAFELNIWFGLIHFVTGDEDEFSKGNSK